MAIVGGSPGGTRLTHRGLDSYETLCTMAALFVLYELGVLGWLSVEDVLILPP